MNEPEPSDPPPSAASLLAAGSVPQPELSLTVRPSIRAYCRSVARGPYRGGGGNPAALLVVVPFAALWITIYKLRCRVVVSDTGVQQRPFFGLTRTASRADVGKVVFVRTYSTTELDQSSQLFVLDRNGRRIVRISSTLWPRQDLDRAIAALNRDIDHHDYLDGRDLKARYPRAATLWDTRPWLMAWLVVAIVVVATVVLVVAFPAISNYV